MTRRRRRTISRSPGQRFQLWYRKMDGDTYAAILERVKDIAAPRFMEYQAVHEHLIATVKNALREDPNASALAHAYVWYAQCIWYASSRYSDKALEREASACLLYFAVLGLNTDHLYNIASALGVRLPTLSEILQKYLGVTVGVAVAPPPPPPKPYTVNKTIGPYKVTNTSPQVVASISVDGLAYIEGVRYVLDNPAGSGTRLYYRIVLRHSQGSTVLKDWQVVEEGASHDDWLRFNLDQVPDNVQLEAVDLEAYVEAAPNTGYEPQATLQLTGLRIA